MNIDNKTRKIISNKIEEFRKSYPKVGDYVLMTTQLGIGYKDRCGIIMKTDYSVDDFLQYLKDKNEERNFDLKNNARYSDILISKYMNEAIIVRDFTNKQNVYDGNLWYGWDYLVFTKENLEEITGNKIDDKRLRLTKHRKPYKHENFF